MSANIIEHVHLSWPMADSLAVCRGPIGPSLRNWTSTVCLSDTEQKS